jgi:hypothetical protein
MWAASGLPRLSLQPTHAAVFRGKGPPAPGRLVLGQAREIHSGGAAAFEAIKLRLVSAADGSLARSGRKLKKMTPSPLPMRLIAPTVGRTDSSCRPARMTP